MAQITDKVRQRFKLLAMQRDLDKADLGLKTTTKTELKVAITAALDKVKEREVNGKLP